MAINIRACGPDGPVPRKHGTQLFLSRYMSLPRVAPSVYESAPSIPSARPSGDEYALQPYTGLGHEVATGLDYGINAASSAAVWASQWLQRHVSGDKSKATAVDPSIEAAAHALNSNDPSTAVLANLTASSERFWNAMRVVTLAGGATMLANYFLSPNPGQDAGVAVAQVANGIHIRMAALRQIIANALTPLFVGTQLAPNLVELRDELNRWGFGPVPIVSNSLELFKWLGSVAKRIGYRPFAAGMEYVISKTAHPIAGAVAAQTVFPRHRAVDRLIFPRTPRSYASRSRSTIPPRFVPSSRLRATRSIGNASLLLSRHICHSLAMSTAAACAIVSPIAAVLRDGRALRSRSITVDAPSMCQLALVLVLVPSDECGKVSRISLLVASMRSIRFRARLPSTRMAL